MSVRENANNFLQFFKLRRLIEMDKNPCAPPPSGSLEIPKSASIVRGKGVAHAEPARIHITYESDFKSEPLWLIRYQDKKKKKYLGLSSWAEDKEGEWKKKDRRDKPKIKGLFLEIKRIETSKGFFVLIEHEGEKKWVNVGNVKPGQKCGPGPKYCPNPKCPHLSLKKGRRKYPPDSKNKKCEDCGKKLKRKAACRCKYRLEFDRAICYGPQYGIKGSAKVEYNLQSRELKLLALRYKTHVEDKRGKLATGKNGGKVAPGWPYVGPGCYRGLVLARKRHEKKYRVPVIWIRDTWHEDKHDWIKGCWLTIRGKKKRARKKGKPKTSKSILIHPTNFPWKLEGCLALGRKFSDYGFVSSKDSQDAVLEVFKLIWTASSKDELFEKLRKLTKSQRLKFIIKVTDGRRHAHQK